MDRLAKEMEQAGPQTTVGQFIADRMDQSRQPIRRTPDKECSRGTRRRRKRQANRWAERGEKPQEPHDQAPIRNRQYRMQEDRYLFAGRELIRREFRREIVHSAFTEARWEAMSEQQRKSVNRAILKFDPDEPKNADKLRAGAMGWWALDGAADAERLTAAWKQRPKLEKRLNLSRRAILNLLPYMEQFDDQSDRWPTQQGARKAYAKVLQARFEQTGNKADRVAAERYATAALGLTASHSRVFPADATSVCVSATSR